MATKATAGRFTFRFLASHIDEVYLQRPGVLVGELQHKIKFWINEATLAKAPTEGKPSPRHFGGGAPKLFLLINGITRAEDIETVRSCDRTSLRAVEIALADMIARGILERKKEGRDPLLRLNTENWRNVKPAADPPKERTKPAVADEPISPAGAPIPASAFVVMPGRASKPILLKEAITIRSVRYCNEGKRGDLNQSMRLDGTELVIVGRLEEAETRRTESERSPKYTSVRKASPVANKQVSSSPPPQNAPSPPARRTLDVEAFQSDAERYRQATDSERAEWKKRYPANFAHAKKQAQGKTHGAGGDA
jgi:hypothetical protein